ncbi:MAG: hypothetical protein COV31_02805 [Candidatus Yanofskybacteria bacterium CG10_big_fil_rev_8_21_14_0_10_46_23]|uniref:Cell division protein FtsL n=1 Tax=Candidatus Yanofskybacteria bacterium CG10_big_fil_rev_8_21_14_0_10_46_23 TaxID=1975098 RepID=A0A2H0R545_9BACT|nr:MAG: hypothetical protein COV31_02805 [Candidatus Yanofskybacteria bacterium CG10_big_fil_rev_8_21_14_0_10_46_23]
MANLKNVQNLKRSETNSRFLILFNFGFLVTCAVLVIFYIIQINVVVSREYRVKVLRDDVSALNKEIDELRAEQLDFDNIPQIAQFAQRAGMVEATGAAYIFEDGDVARR